MLRLAVVAIAVAGLALIAPKVAPDLLSAFLTSRPDIGDAGVAAPNAATAASSRQMPALSPSGRKAIIAADADGHYVANARINGRMVPVMVDTGATTVALTAETARRLQLTPPAAEFRVAVQTANGTVKAARVTIGEIRIDNVTARNVEAIVLPAGALNVNLLGMTFLSNISSFSSERGTFVLMQ